MSFRNTLGLNWEKKGVNVAEKGLKSSQKITLLHDNYTIGAILFALISKIYNFYRN